MYYEMQNTFIKNELSSYVEKKKMRCKIFCCPKIIKNWAKKVKKNQEY